MGVGESMIKKMNRKPASGEADLQEEIAGEIYRFITWR
jgi:hypothetical protein